MTGPRHADRPSHVARFTSASTSEGSPLNPDTLEVAPGTVHESVQGWVPKLATEEELRIALEKAFDYRGDVTLTLKDNSKIEGYLFDRTTGSSLTNSFVRVLPKDSAEKSWEAWVGKYWEKKVTGEGDLSLQPEALE